MELYEEILINMLKRHPDALIGTFNQNTAILLTEQICYQTLKKIKAIIEDDSLDDPECFAKIEQIVRVFEDIGSDGGFRHDFG